MLLIYTPHITNRLRYTLNFIFNDFLGIEYKTTNSIDEYNNTTALAKLNYSRTAGTDIEIMLFPHGLLKETGINEQTIKVASHSGTPMFFGTSANATLPYDLFACVFYMISRYEEYLPTIRDNHDRFHPQNTLAFQNNFLQLAVVDRWIMQLQGVLLDKFPTLKYKNRGYEYISTIDIDNAYAYLHKGLIRSTLSLVRDVVHLDVKQLTERFRVFAGMSNDPYNTYEYIHAQHKKHNTKVIFFFLVGHYGQYDTNLSIKNKSFQSLIKSIADVSTVGLHPSYGSNTEERYLAREKKSLERVTHRYLTASRQHFLKLQFPETYRRLLLEDFKDDYSMGFAQQPGFRAGTCTPFLFYDLDLESETKLRIHPFQVMEATLHLYQKLSIDEAKHTIAQLVKETKHVQGTFISLWHNETLSENSIWKNWRGVFEYCLEEASDNLKI
ncbi:MAG: polysaccharide deacetylase family protein [Bacteroidia bacterium]|nr:polysaccharide deacetylase family protein [Bacteroidia bacterium]